MKLSRLKPAFDASGIGLVAISADSQKDSRQLLKEKPIEVPLLSDPELTTIKSWGVAMEGQDIAVPATFIVSQDKIVRWKYIGQDMTDRPDEREIINKAKSLRTR